MQHPNEAPRVIEIGDHSALGDLEAHLTRGNAGAVEALDHELEELQIAERLPGDVDRDAAAGRHRYRATAERGERRLHHPAVDESHEAVALGGTHELRRRQIVPGLIL